jgi:hypothetical protein
MARTSKSSGKKKRKEIDYRGLGKVGFSRLGGTSSLPSLRGDYWVLAPLKKTRQPARDCRLFLVGWVGLEPTANSAIQRGCSTLLSIDQRVLTF